MKDIIAMVGIALVVLGGSGMDSPDMLIPVGIVIIGGIIVALTGVWRE